MTKNTINARFAKAEKRGYDTGKPSSGSKPPPSPKVKPKIGKEKVGATVHWKF